MGMHCLGDTINFPRDKVCSINHVYSEGTLLNNIGNGLEMRTITFKESVFSKSVEYDNYLLFYKFGSVNKHNCLYYSRKVNHSTEVKR